jgi:hypothetical protein
MKGLLVVLFLLLLIVTQAPVPSRAQLPGPAVTVSGQVWHDANGNGRFDSGESTVAGIVVVSESFMGWQQTTTDEAGRYRFEGIIPGRSNQLGVLNSAGPAGPVWAPMWVMTTSPVRTTNINLRFAVSLSAQSNVYDIGLIAGATQASFRGTIDIPAPPPHPRVQAFVNGRDCSLPGGLVPPASVTGYSITVASATAIPGCGQNGDQVSFFVDGVKAHETAPWQPELFTLDLTVGSVVAGPPSPPAAPTSLPPAGREESPPASNETRRPPTPGLIQPPSTGTGGLLSSMH